MPLARSPVVRGRRSEGRPPPELPRHPQIEVGGGGYVPPPRVVPVGGVGGGGGENLPPLPSWPGQPSSLTGGGTAEFSAEEYGPLVDLQKQYAEALGEFDPETDRQAIRLAQDIRDLSSGQKAERQAGYAARGLRGGGDVSDLLEAQVSGETTRAAGRAMADYRAARAGQKLGAIRGGTGVAAAPAELALREKSFQAQIRESEANRAIMQANQTLQQYLALLSAQRTSPLYEEEEKVKAVPTIRSGGVSGRRPASIFM